VCLLFICIIFDLTDFVILLKGAMQFAMACGLHTIASPKHPLPSSLLSYPLNCEDVKDRVNAFWSLFIMDRGGSVCVGLNIAIPDEVRSFSHM
jgi:hypothetical protein